MRVHRYTMSKQSGNEWQASHRHTRRIHGHTPHWDTMSRQSGNEWTVCPHTLAACTGTPVQ